MQVNFKGNLMQEIHFTGVMPQFMSEGAAGADLKSLYEEVLYPDDINLIDTGTAVAIPEGHFGMVLPRSSICNKRGLMMANSCGIIDSDYRGTIKVPFRNIGKDNVIIPEGERIAQLVIVPFVKPSYTEVKILNETDRGEGGFGSTGA